MKNYRSITASNERPVSITGFKRNMNFNVADTSKDEHFGTLLDIAADEAKQYTGRDLVPAIYELQTNEFSEAVIIDKAPVTGVNSVQYFDASNEVQSLVSGTDYAVYLSDDNAEVRFNTTPAVYDRPDAVRINFGCGYAGELVLPPAIKGAILFAATDYYMNPGDSKRQFPTKSRSLLRHYRLHNYDE